MPNKKRSRKPGNSSKEPTQPQAKRLRPQKQTEQDHVEVLQLGTTEETEQSRPKGNQTTVGPTHKQGTTSNFVDFETILNESNICPLLTQKETQSTEMIPNDPEIMTNFHFEEESLRLGGEDMTAHVPQQLCQKIWSHQYINLALLLKGNVELQVLCSGGLVHITEKGQIETRPKINY